MGRGVIAPLILNMVLDGGELSALRHGRFTLWEEPPGIHLIGGWMGHRARIIFDEESRS